MRECDGRRMVTRIKGKPVLIRRLRGLLVAVNRFGQHRARSRADIVWAAKFSDSLTAALSAITTDEPARASSETTSATR